MHYTLLWTDALLYILLLIIIFFVIWVRNHAYLRAPWHQVAHNRLGMIAAVILIMYSMIGLLDSIHFHPQVESSRTNSLLDILLSPLGENDERTYTAPFAQQYTHLQNVDQQVSIPEQRSKNIILLTMKGAVQGLIINAVLVLSVFLWIRYRRKTTFKKTFVAWPAILITATIIILIACIALNLSSEYHILGTNKVGRDVFYESLKSIRTGLVIGTLTTLFMLPFAVILGCMAGYFGGWIDDVIQYVYTTLSSIPAVLLVTAAILSLQVFISNHPEWFPDLTTWADARLLALCAILGVTSWTYLCRLLRGETLKLRELDYVQAALAMGVRQSKIISKHIFPNVAHIILITVVIDFSGLVLAEAVLSYVGVGVDPSTISWGNMINSARLELAREPIVWWPLLSAFIFMFGLVLSANLFADAVRDAFDPRLRVIENE